MTSHAVICCSDAVHVVTDGGLFDQKTGVLVGFGNKALILSHLNAVLVCRGALAMGLLVPMMVSANSSFDELRKNIGPQLRKQIEPHANIDAQHGHTWGEFDVVLAGFSESKGPTCILMLSFDHPFIPELKAYQPFDAGPVSLAPGNDDLLKSIDPNSFDVERDPLRIIEAQRKIPSPHGARGDSSVKCSVGGFAQLTTVTETEITTKLIHRWNDKIGEVIKP